MYTTSSAMLSALREAGVQYLFVNLGSDHSAFMEAYATARASQDGGEFPYPDVITCPNEMVALSAAHGHAAVSGRAQAVLVHVECGTQALAGAVHNAAKGRIPVLIFATPRRRRRKARRAAAATNSFTGSRMSSTSAAWSAVTCAMTMKSE